jgi:tetratricopeptide (TPR) repeat protein
LNPANVGNMQGLGWDYLFFGQIEKGLETFDKAIRLSPRDSTLQYMYNGESWGFFALKQYDQAIDWARRSISVNMNYQHPHILLIAALALNDQETEAREAFQGYLALSASERLKTIGAWKKHDAQFINRQSDPRVLDVYNRIYEGLRKARMSEE